MVVRCRDHDEHHPAVLVARVEHDESGAASLPLPQISCRTPAWPSSRSCRGSDISPGFGPALRSGLVRPCGRVSARYCSSYSCRRGLRFQAVVWIDEHQVATGSPFPSGQCPLPTRLVAPLPFAFGHTLAVVHRALGEHAINFHLAHGACLRSSAEGFDLVRSKRHRVSTASLIVVYRSTFRYCCAYRRTILPQTGARRLLRQAPRSEAWSEQSSPGCCEGWVALLVQLCVWARGFQVVPGLPVFLGILSVIGGKFQTMPRLRGWYSSSGSGRHKARSSPYFPKSAESANHRFFIVHRSSHLAIRARLMLGITARMPPTVIAAPGRSTSG